jgi:outer membrane PBP1 activator LpoA protein
MRMRRGGGPYGSRQAGSGRQLKSQQRQTKSLADYARTAERSKMHRNAGITGLSVVDGRIDGVFVVANPDKLRGLPEDL